MNIEGFIVNEKLVSFLAGINQIDVESNGKRVLQNFLSELVQPALSKDYV